MDKPPDPRFVLSSDDASSDLDEIKLEISDNEIEENVKYKCIKCDLEFDNIDDVKDHDTIEHRKISKRNSNKRCRLCSKYFHNRVQLKKHLISCRMRYELNHIYDCKYCSDRFTTTNERRKHISYCHKNEAKFVCKFQDCGFRTNWRSSFNRHFKIKHTNCDMYACKFCGHEENREGNLIKHQETCQNNPHIFHLKDDTEIENTAQSAPAAITPKQGVYICKKCKLDFITAGACEAHMLDCDPLFTCDSCGVRFQIKNNLLVHQMYCIEKGNQMACKEKDKPQETASDPQKCLDCDSIVVDMNKHKNVCNQKPSSAAEFGFNLKPKTSTEKAPQTHYLKGLISKNNKRKSLESVSNIFLKMLKIAPSSATQKPLKLAKQITTATTVKSMSGGDDCIVTKEETIDTKTNHPTQSPTNIQQLGDQVTTAPALDSVSVDAEYIVDKVYNVDFKDSQNDKGDVHKINRVSKNDNQNPFSDLSVIDYLSKQNLDDTNDSLECQSIVDSFVSCAAETFHLGTDTDTVSGGSSPQSRYANDAKSVQPKTKQPYDAININAIASDNQTSSMSHEKMFKTSRNKTPQTQDTLDSKPITNRPNSGASNQKASELSSKRSFDQFVVRESSNVGGITTNKSGLSINKNFGYVNSIGSSFNNIISIKSVKEPKDIGTDVSTSNQQNIEHENTGHLKINRTNTNSQPNKARVVPMNYSDSLKKTTSKAEQTAAWCKDVSDVISKAPTLSTNLRKPVRNSETTPQDAIHSNPESAVGSPNLVCFTDDVLYPVRYNLDNPQNVVIPNFSINADIMDQIRTIYHHQWANIMSFVYMNKRSSIYNFRLENGGFDLQDFKHFLSNQVYKTQKYCFKINFSPGFFLYAPNIPYKNNKQSKESSDSPVGSVQLYHPSFVNFGFYNKPKIINNYIDFVEFLDGLDAIDLLNFCKNSRPNTVWQLLFACQIEIRITKIMPYILGGKFTQPVGCGINLPHFIAQKKCITPLVRPIGKNKKLKKGKYTDNLCFFRCLALARKGTLANVDKKAKQFFFYFYGEDAKILDYKGITFDELSKIERIFSINVNVFELKQNKKDKTDIDCEPIANLLRESACTYPEDLNCSLWKNHYSFITNISLYCKKYPCQKCGKIFQKIYKLKRHIKVECGVSKNIFPGGVYTSQENIFDMLESEGICIPKTVDRYFKYRIIYDTESFQYTKNLPENTQSISYTATHQLASAAVISNVPKYKKPKVFMVSDTVNSHEVAVNMLQYMIEISDEVYR